MLSRVLLGGYEFMDKVAQLYSSASDGKSHTTDRRTGFKESFAMQKDTWCVWISSENKKTTLQQLWNAKTSAHSIVEGPVLLRFVGRCREPSKKQYV